MYYYNVITLSEFIGLGCKHVNNLRRLDYKNYIC